MGTSTSANTNTDPDSDSHPNQRSSPDRLLFDFERFLEGGALNDIFKTPRDSPTPTPISTEGGKWEITKLSGGFINVTVRVTLHRRGDDGGPWRDPRSVVIKYAPPFVAAMGEGTPFGTFRQASTPPLPVIATRPGWPADSPSAPCRPNLES